MMTQKKKIVVLSGAGVSAESGIPTFRDANGLWEGYDVMEVASPNGWQKNRDLVLDFYNQRRQALRNVIPNKAHLALAALEKDYQVIIITQNIDNLHERAGSSKIIHLHGELLKAQSTLDSSLVYDLDDKDIYTGDKCEHGSQLRPFVVWFGEPVPKMEEAVNAISDADYLLIIGTSLQVYPAAGLIHNISSECKILLVDPNIPSSIKVNESGFYAFEEKASIGVELAIEKIHKLTKATV